MTFQKREQRSPPVPGHILTIFLFFFQEKRVRVRKYFLYCYEVTPDFAKQFKFPKCDEGGEFRIRSMEAAFDKETQRGEFYIEFVDPVYDDNLIECFEAQGAKGVQTITFQYNDGSESAINALACVLTMQDKTGSKVTRGVSSLLKDARDKQVKDAKQEELLSKEVSEKDAAAIKKSLEDVNGNFKEVKDGVHSCEVKLESCEVGIVEMKHDVKSHGVVMGDIKNGLCNVIPDYQIENKNLKADLKHQKWLCDVQESKTAAQTTKVNKLKAEISSFHVREDASLKREEAYLKRIKELEDILEVRKTIENAKQIAQLAQEDRAFLKEELAFARSERAASRQFAVDSEEAVILEENEEERATKRPRV